MRILRLLASQSLLLGGLAFVLWTVLIDRGNWALRLSSDTLAACGLAVLLTCVFLTFVALPVQFAMRNWSLAPRLAAGLLCGPIGVWLGLMVITYYPITPEWYVTRAWQLHVVYYFVGLCFAIAWHMGLRPNNSFKPSPHQGGA